LSDPRIGQANLPLVNAVQIMAKNPLLAEIRLREILKVHPEELNATIYLSRALRAQGKFASAASALESLKATHPGFAIAHYELALTQSDLGERAKAIEGIRRAIRLDPNIPNAWLVLADLLIEIGDRAGADNAYMRHIEVSAKAPHILAAMTALHNNEFEKAEAVLRAHLARLPTDLAAIIVLAETKSRLGDNDEAATIFARCVKRVPSFAIARLNYATTLCRLQRPEEALIQTEKLLERDPHDLRFRALHAIALNQSGGTAQAIRYYESLLQDFPNDCKSWAGYGHALRASGDPGNAIAAYRRSMTINPLHGDAYWGIANLKTVHFAPDEIGALEGGLARSDLPEDDRVAFHFALATAREDERRFDESFAHYEKGNALRFSHLRYRPEDFARRVRTAKKFFTNKFLESRLGQGNPAPDPIFILGLPRSGSTLIEQILASHSAVEGTTELPDLRMIMQRLDERAKDGGAPRYPRCLAGTPPDDLRKLGEDYIASTRRQRKSARPFFTDKMPSNFEHIGLIHLILPNAKIIDARRHPLGCCLSNYRQFYAQGQHFSYDLTALGRYYAGYVELMAHFDSVLPGRIHRVFHEDVVADPEREIRRLLDYCALPFEETCLKFYETKRPVRTVSSEQVRQPIFSDGVDHWRNFEPWLDPLKVALGPVLDAYPNAPAVAPADSG
jgi:tetratricopeptide (TPR) repeat protein